jgi:hypothetical protein
MLISALLLVAAGPASAEIKIKRIAFDPSRADTNSNRQLNREYIYLVNSGENDVQLRHWKIVDRGRDHTYRFDSLYLSPGDSIRLHTGQGDDGAPTCEEGKPCPKHAHYDLYWDLDNYVWNNDGDRATLIRANGKVVDECTYMRSNVSPVRC